MENSKAYGEKSNNNYYISKQIAEMPLNNDLKLYLENSYKSYDYNDLVANERFNDFLNLDLVYNQSNLQAAFGYQMRYFDQQKTNTIIRDNAPISYKKQLKHLLEFSSDWSNDQFSWDNELYLSSTDHLRKRLIEDSNFKDYKDNNCFYNAFVNYSFYKGLSGFSELYLKEDLSDDKNYSQRSASLGFAYKNSFNFFNHVEMSSQWIWNKSDYVYNKNQILSQFRYKYRMGTNLNAFLSYINRSSYDNNQHEFLLISNYLRAQIKYSFENDPNTESYLLCGIKSSDENKAGAFFTSTNYNVWHNLYLGYDFDYYQIDIRTHEFKTLWYFLPQSYLSLSYSMLNDNNIFNDVNTLNLATVFAF